LRAALAARVAARLGLDQEQIELARLAGSLHDLGKLAIPEEILRKPGPLTGPERLVLERHPQIGFRMLDSLGIEPVADWILHHHERWDGRSYPDRLPGPEIPQGSRIIFVVDAYDAMTSDRVYRGRLSQAEALAELQRCAGTQFDPAVAAPLAEELELDEVTARGRHIGVSELLAVVGDELLAPVVRVVSLVQLAPKDDVDRALWAHHGDLRGRPGEVEVRADVLRAHDVVRPAVRLARDHRE